MTPLKRSRLTQRNLYFAIVWAPTLLLLTVPLSFERLCIFAYAAPFHLPAALYLSVTALGKPTRELLRKSWWAPLVGALSTLFTFQFVGVLELPTKHVRQPLTYVQVRSMFLFSVLGAAVAAGLLLLGWLLLVTVARNWPLDRTAQAASRPPSPEQT